MNTNTKNEIGATEIFLLFLVLQAIEDEPSGYKAQMATLYPDIISKIKRVACNLWNNNQMETLKPYAIMAENHFNTFRDQGQIGEYLIYPITLLCDNNIDTTMSDSNFLFEITSVTWLFVSDLYCYEDFGSAVFSMD